MGPRAAPVAVPCAGQAGRTPQSSLAAAQAAPPPASSLCHELRETSGVFFFPEHRSLLGLDEALEEHWVHRANERTSLKESASSPP